MNLSEYMNQGISLLVKTAGRFYLKNPRGLAFLARTAPEIRKSTKRREAAETGGLHVPPFLIASIASQCNLHCTGCYARASGACSSLGQGDLLAAEWEKIFSEAYALGISFVILAGGEPLTRRDVVEAAARFPGMIFPVFTNGTLMDEETSALFERHRNLIPVFSVEGGQAETDARRGDGAFQTVERAMAYFRKKSALFGVSVTVTSENLKQVATHDFVKELRGKGCGLVFFVEYVPVEAGTEYLTLAPEGVQALQQKVNALRDDFPDTVLVSFPGDEEATGGCLASGRGFFHINAAGGAEPCPFSPYSTLNLRDHSLEDALRSGFFSRLRSLAMAAGHNGGCTLFDHRDEVAALQESH